MIPLTSASLRCSLSTGATRRDTGDSSASSPLFAANPCLRCKRKCGRESQKRERTRMSGRGNRDRLY